MSAKQIAQIAALEKRATRLPPSERTVIHVVFVEDWPKGEAVPGYDIILEPDGTIRREAVPGGHYYDTYSGPA